MAGDLAVRLAAARGIVGDTPMLELAVEDAVRVEIGAGDRHARDLDRTGAWWPAGALSRAREEALSDRRLGFLDALPRSITFGRRLAHLTAWAIGRDEPSDEALGAAQAMNVFVTVFDGLCDECPDRLPALLADLQPRFAGFPRAGDPPTPSGSATADLVSGLVHRTTLMLEPCFADASPALAAAAARAVGSAFEAQVAGASCPAAEARERLSVLTFRATLGVVALVDRADPSVVPRLARVARTSGALFGWIDDVADWESDGRAGRPNMLALGLERAGGPSGAVGLVRSETMRFWDDLIRSLEETGRAGMMRGELESAAMAWLGVRRAA